jgi:SNW domain-containing protein 1
MDLLKELPKPSRSGGDAPSAQPLTAPQASKPEPRDQLHAQAQAQAQQRGQAVPPYGARSRSSDFVPRSESDFGSDGGAFPEVHVAQYPRGMGRSTAPSKTLSTQPNSSAPTKAVQEAIVKQGENKSKVVHTGHDSLKPKLHERSSGDLARPNEEEEEETAQRTAQALQQKLDSKLANLNPKKAPDGPKQAQYIKYTPSKQGGEYNSGASQRIIQMQEVQEDPLEPPRFRHKKLPSGPSEAPVPVLHSPPRKVSQEEAEQWQVPPCISNWKNPKGFTIPLDKRLAADGRGLEEVQINDNFAKLTESLYIAEQKAREAVETRAQLQKELKNKEKEKTEEQLRELAQKARLERAAGTSDPEERAAASTETAAAAEDAGDPEAEDNEDPEGKRKRDEIREERRKERERERRREEREGRTAKRTKTTRDSDRDVSEKVALGQAAVQPSGEAMFDQRLFNQDQGLSSGFGMDDQNNAFDTNLFADRSHSLYKPSTSAGAAAATAGDEAAGLGSGSGGRTGPVQFEGDGKQGQQRQQQQQEEDPFGLSQFLSEVSRGGGRVQTSGGASGTLNAAAGGSAPGEGTGARSIQFARGTEDEE